MTIAPQCSLHGSADTYVTETANMNENTSSTDR